MGTRNDKEQGQTYNPSDMVYFTATTNNGNNANANGILNNQISPKNNTYKRKCKWYFKQSNFT